MSDHIDSQLLTKQLYILLEEVFENVHGAILDKGTSLFETLATLSAEQASRSILPDGTTIAGQVEHARFYLHVTEDYMAGKEFGKLDWKQSWLCHTVTPSQWDDIRKGLREDYARITTMLKNITDWNDEKRLGGAISIIAHTAYHLGAIRQILHIARN